MEGFATFYNPNETERDLAQIIGEFIYATFSELMLFIE